MTNEIIDIDDNDQENPLEDTEEIVEEINYAVSTNIYRRKLINKILVVFVSTILIFITRFFKHADFDIIMASSLFVFLLGVSVAMGIGILLYMNISKDKIDTMNENKTHKSLLNVFDLVSVVPIFMAIVSIVNILLISPATVIGQSMEPTFYEGEDILMSHITNEYERFDVVVLKTDSGEFYLKRIIGLPGDTVKIDHNIITINGVEIEQTFLEDENGSISVYTYCNTNNIDVCEFNVPQNSYFVMGDNREHSLDSRSSLLGYVDESQLYGKVIIKFNNIFRNVLN